MSKRVRLCKVIKPVPTMRYGTKPIPIGTKVFVNTIEFGGRISVVTRRHMVHGVDEGNTGYIAERDNAEYLEELCTT